MIFQDFPIPNHQHMIKHMISNHPKNIFFQIFLSDFPFFFRIGSGDHHLNLGGMATCSDAVPATQ